ncbi:hypothetical protein SPV_2517 [Streptococcus pneumoniae]|nr:hypothetical protein SPV_2517 [Streptococcus pneumoniae]
MEEIAFLT